ncbi:MAG: hypothetical protein HZA17_09930 [Nitrospirae bacterium]|nr:hypothetical protein [Nitrospirota bacterium]
MQGSRICIRPKPFGWFVILYAFFGSYYGVGSIKNFLSPTLHLSSAQSGLVVVYGLCWISYFIGGTGLVFRKQWGRWLVRIAAAISVLTLIIGQIIYIKFLDVIISPGLLFIFARPIPDIAILYATLLRTANNAERTDETEHGPSGKTLSYLIVASGAVLPWITGLFIRKVVQSSAELLGLSGVSGILIPAFMTIWFSIPFILLVLFSKALVRRDGSKRPIGLIFSGGITGGAAAGIFVNILMWGPPFNSFMMAVSPPFLVSGVCVGMLGGWLAEKVIR